MFTIKHLNYEKNLKGYEVEIVSLWEGENVRSYLHTYTDEKGATYEIYTVAFDQPNGCLCTIDSGIIYVMNAAGKTVETFRLKRPDFEQEPIAA